jgi:hypothetical protein
MRKLNQGGAIDSWLIAFILTLLVLFGAAGFGFWAFNSRQDYKNHVDAKINMAVSAAEKQLSAKKEVEFAEKEKNPLRTYHGPAAYGSLNLSYPKTWAAYIDESARTLNPVDGYLNPAFVPAIDGQSNMALRFQVVGSSYTSIAKTFETNIKSGKLTATPYTLPKVPGIVGLRLDGEVETGKQGAVIILPLRDKTLKVWTQSTQFVPDFNNIILANLSFEP